MELLEDLLRGEDFSKAVNNLASEFRQTHGLPEIHQLGLVVPDVEKAADMLESKGIGPFFIASGAPVSWLERGEERSISGKLAMAYYHGFELELLEPTEGSDFYRQSLDPAGGIVVQHLGFLVKDVDDWAKKLSKAGSPVWVRGRLQTGPMKTDFAYMDTMDACGIVIEFISWRVFGWYMKPPAGLFRAVGRLEKWTGKRCIPL